MTSDDHSRAIGKMQKERGKKHIGFTGAQAKVAKEGYSEKEAGAIVASASRNASKKAKAANPALKKVKGDATY